MGRVQVSDTGDFFNFILKIGLSQGCLSVIETYSRSTRESERALAECAL